MRTAVSGSPERVALTSSYARLPFHANVWASILIHPCGSGHSDGNGLRMILLGRDKRHRHRHTVSDLRFHAKDHRPLMLA